MTHAHAGYPGLRFREGECPICAGAVGAWPERLDKVSTIRHAESAMKPTNHWNPERVALCTCGWSGRFKNLRIANAMSAAHVAEGCEGCDHAVRIEEA